MDAFNILMLVLLYIIIIARIPPGFFIHKSSHPGRSDGNDSRSTRRPSHGSSAQKMNMEMENGLPTIRTCIHHHPIAPLVQAKLSRHLPNGRHQAIHQPGRRASEFIQRGKMRTGNNQDMDRRLGIQVPEGHNLLILINLLGFTLTGGNFTKHTPLHGFLTASSFKTLFRSARYLRNLSKTTGPISRSIPSMKRRARHP